MNDDINDEILTITITISIKISEVKLKQHYSDIDECNIYEDRNYNSIDHSDHNLHNNDNNSNNWNIDNHIMMIKTMNIMMMIDIVTTIASQ